MQPIRDELVKHKDPAFRKYSWDRVHPARMSSWGFHNCNLISDETGWEKWNATLKPFEKINRVSLIPCRKPVDHFKSMCNHMGINVNELFKDITQENACSRASKCLLGTDRFALEMLRSFDVVALFHFSAFDDVFDLLDQYLPKRVLPLASNEIYVTNTKRKKETEILGSCSEEELDRFLRRSWSYYAFCDRLVDKNITVLSLRPSPSNTIG